MTNFEWGSKINALPYGMLYLMSALFLGTAVIYQPVIAIAAVLLIILLVVSITRPELISYFVLLTTAVSINFLYPGSMFGVEILSLYKLVILMLLVPCILVNGLKFRLSPPLWAMVGLLFITFGTSIWLPEMNGSIAIKAFIGLSLPFVFLLINWKREVAERQIRIIASLPLMSVLAGIALQVAHLHSFLDVEFTGAVRVQGANIPAHLAMLAFMGVGIAFIEIKRSPQHARYFYTMLALNFLILIGTGTRGPILALVLMALYYFYDISRQYLKGRTQFLIPLLCSVILIFSAVYLQLDNIKKRSFERTTETTVDLSGRAEAWEYFLNKAADSPWSGRGLGAVTVANDGTLYKGFVVPHNEYIRFYFDGGYIGAILLLISLLAVFTLVYRALAKPVKPYYLFFIAGFMIYSFSDNTLSTVQSIIPFCWYLNCLYRSSQPTDSPQKEVIR
ncbi:polysaccharide polymerase [Paenibacillus helianthi]|uniref:Polysaccharide polymerase n=1 Tax=Paenibacillus helianthi TaxID=1349432 RepID=A0ABX3EK46_9BACL|nr:MULTISPECIES: O-antigen ligase family protein [Paenibacillus]OKP81971.1 polysaccharide polymerase [Paenibacillus helianthi]OKP94560.1 polysaccharide polymerase [Paenibacillus sp. P32E]